MVDTTGRDQSRETTGTPCLPWWVRILTLYGAADRTLSLSIDPERERERIENLRANGWDQEGS